MLVAGPNGQGVVSTPSSLCAQIVAPYPPAGPIGIASQSGNFVSSFMNYAAALRRRHQPGRVGRQRRRRRASPTTSTTTPTIPPPTVGLAYVEGLVDGRAFIERMRSGRPSGCRSCS